MTCSWLELGWIARRRRRAWRSLALGLALLVTGCASDPADAAGRVPLRLAILAAPRIGAEPAEGAEGTEGAAEALSSEDLLLEAVTQLSGVGELHYVLVPGPLLARPEQELHLGLTGALGSLAAPVILGLAEGDGPREELLEALGEALREHDGEAGQWGPVKEGWRALALTWDGAWPKAQEERAGAKEKRAADAPAPRLIVVHGGPAPEKALSRAGLVVEVGDEAALRLFEGRVHVTVPSLTRPPHVLGLLVVGPERVELRLRSLTGVEREVGALRLPASAKD